MDSIQSRPRLHLPDSGARPAASGGLAPGDEVAPRPQDPQVEQDRRLRELVRRMPKVDLHRHMEGAITPELMVRLGKKYNIELPSYDPEELRPYLQVGPQDKTLLDFLKKFDTIGLAFKNQDAVREIAYQTVIDASKDNVKYLELRFSPIYIAKQYNLDLDAVMQAVADGVRQAQKDCGTRTNLIVIVERQMGEGPAWQAEKLAEKYKDQGVVALDLANDEYNYPPGPYAAVFQAAKQAGLHVTVHAGEAGGADNVRVSVEELGADRIGHGVRSFEDPRVEKMLADRGVVLEMCPTSNFQTGASQDVASYPMRRYYNQGIPVTVNTDDPAVSGIELSDDYVRVVAELGFTLPELQSMVLNGVRGAFTSQAEKEALEKQFSEEFGKIARECGYHEGFLFSGSH